MTDTNTSPGQRAPEEDARDLLARLYREIGISAVAAALEVTVPKAEAHATASASPDGEELAA